MSAPWEWYITDPSIAGMAPYYPSQQTRYIRADLVLGLLREAQEYMTHAPICRGMPKCNCGYRDLDRRIDAILAGKEPRP